MPLALPSLRGLYFAQPSSPPNKKKCLLAGCHSFSLFLIIKISHIRSVHSSVASAEPFPHRSPLRRGALDWCAVPSRESNSGPPYRTDAQPPFELLQQQAVLISNHPAIQPSIQTSSHPTSHSHSTIHPTSNHPTSQPFSHPTTPSNRLAFKQASHSAIPPPIKMYSHPVIHPTVQRSNCSTIKPYRYPNHPTIHHLNYPNIHQIHLLSIHPSSHTKPIPLSNYSTIQPSSHEKILSN
jgi:hypothetical protein